MKTIAAISVFVGSLMFVFGASQTFALGTGCSDALAINVPPLTLQCSLTGLCPPGHTCTPVTRTLPDGSVDAICACSFGPGPNDWISVGECELAIRTPPGGGIRSWFCFNIVCELLDDECEKEWTGWWMQPDTIWCNCE